ncbi:flagellar basal body rod protein FlgB [Halobacillus litoralis]|uniref:Flagellar basal body rod protein FlgB n=1 Tax=Halobacillus litoralis TaxID=45668 RepID=A0A845DP47_9BACI|nr:MULTISPECIES: flagellar basal body rod protein FlgB [Halobacillus]MYL19186.1 flagellar basal body rod protein FlgB [Halobacillus litoralis]MYL28332.1 flagellar basal body rod protein FlgB [Halobacillus halophilus]MYL37736.1 flagellar basal body rod protein FlgB [Halobacillus litoralis]
MSLFNDTFTSLHGALDYSAAKNRAVSSNIANADTPGYKAEGVAFKDILAEKTSFQTKITRAGHIDFNADADPSFTTYKKHATSYHPNGNNVDIDKEMNELAKNQIQYQALVERMNGKFQSLQSVLKGGG